MPPQESWQLRGSAPELFERYLVPAVTAPWAADLVAVADPPFGARVLDVAAVLCGGERPRLPAGSPCRGGTHLSPPAHAPTVTGRPAARLSIPRGIGPILTDTCGRWNYSGSGGFR
jgi:hypothetical protein